MHNLFLNRKVYTILLVCFILAILYGLWKPPVYLHFIDGLTYAAMIILTIGLFRWIWKEGEFSRREDGKRLSAMEKQKIAEERKNLPNDPLYAGILLMIVVTVLSLLY